MRVLGGTFHKICYRESKIIFNTYHKNYIFQSTIPFLRGQDCIIAKLNYEHIYMSRFGPMLKDFN